MERVIYLEPDEEITSILDKLKKTEEKSIILVIPSEATLLQSLVNLKLLSKKAIELEKEIALVTSDKIGRNLASLAGLSVYSDIKEKGKIVPSKPRLSAPPGVVVKTYVPSLERVEEPKPPERPSEKPPEKPTPPSLKFPRPPIPVGFWLSLIISFFAVSLILYFVLPKATVLLKVKTENYTQTTEITVDAKATDLDLENKIIPGEPKELEQEETKKSLATGKMNVGGKASGTVTITNSFKNPDGSGEEFSLKVGAEFKDKKTGKIFLSTKAVTVPKLTYDVNTGREIPGTTSVKVTASEPGESYNIGPSQFSIPGLGISSVYGTSSENMTGGYDKFAAVVSDSDISKAKDEISKDLFTKAKKELESKLEKEQKFLEGGVFEEVLEALPSEKAGAQVSEFEMRVKVRISTLVVLEKDYKTLLSHFLENNLPSDKRLVSTPSDTVELSLVSYDPHFQIMRLKATLNSQVAPKINEERLKEEITKKGQEEAISYLKSLEEIQDVSIRLWPFWTKKLPSQDKIKIKIKP